MGKTAGNNRNSNISVKNDKKSDRKKYINLKLNKKVKGKFFHSNPNVLFPT